MTRPANQADLILNVFVVCPANGCGSPVAARHHDSPWSTAVVD